MELQVSNHATNRFKDRNTNIHVGNKQIDSVIRKAIKKGNEIKPINGAIKLMNNNYKPALYYQYMGLVFVVENNTVKTVYKYEKRKWESVNNK